MKEIVLGRQKRLSATLIKAWWKVSQHDALTLSQWEDLRDDFGAALPFFINPKVYAGCPFPKLGIPEIKLENLVPGFGEAWVIFCYTVAPNNPRSPVRTDGFVLPLEWRRNTSHSDLIPASLSNLADQILMHRSGSLYRSAASVSVEHWGLHPSRQRFGDHYDFSDEKLISDNVGSASGALLAGLESAISGYAAASGAFCSLQLNAESGLPANVEGIEKKLSVASSYLCKEFVVAASQVQEATHALRQLSQRGVFEAKSIRIIPADPRPETLPTSILYAHLDWLRPTVFSAPRPQEFIGRQWLVDESLSTNTVITSIVGLPGSGKSALINKLALELGDKVLAYYTCPHRPAQEFIKTLAYRIALRFPDAFRTVGMDRIRDLAEKKLNWKNLKAFYEVAVVGPLCNHSAEEEPVYILIDALDETLDRNIVKLLSEAETQLPSWVRVILSTRPLQDIQHLLNRVPLHYIDLDAEENAVRCKKDLEEYIKHSLAQPEIAKLVDSSLTIDAVQVSLLLQEKAISYRYAYNTFLNILNGTYTLEQLEKQLPEGVQGHYLAFFDSHIAPKWDKTKALLQILVASPIAPSKAFSKAVLDYDLTETIASMHGYILEEDGCILLSDYVLREWLSDQEHNPDFYIDPKAGHQRLAQYGWSHFSQLAAAYDNEHLSSADLETIKRQLPLELQDTLALHVVRVNYLDSCNAPHYASILLAMTREPEHAAAILNAIRCRTSPAQNKRLSWKAGALIGAILVSLFAFVTAFYNNFSRENPIDDKTRSTVTDELLSMTQTIDRHLAAFDTSWPLDKEQHLKKLWQEDSTPNKAFLAKQCDALIDALILHTESDRFRSQLSNLRSKPLNKDIEAILLSFDDLYKNEQDFLRSLEKLKFCRSEEVFQQQINILATERNLIPLLSEYAFLNQLSLLRKINPSLDQRDDINVTLAALTQLSPKMLISQNKIGAYLQSKQSQIRTCSRARDLKVNPHDPNMFKRMEALSALSSDISTQSHSSHDDLTKIREQNALSPEDDSPYQWHKITSLLGLGMYQDAQQQLDNYLDFNPKQAHIQTIVSTAKAYVSLVQRGKPPGEIIIHAIPDFPHSFLKPGDIITHLDGKVIMDTIDYRQARQQTGNLIKEITFMRLNRTSNTFQTHRGRPKLMEPKLILADLLGITN